MPTMMMKKSGSRMDEKTKMLIGVAVCALVSYVLYNFSIIPLIERQKYLKNDYATRKNILSKTREQASDTEGLSVLEKEVQQKADRLKKINGMFVPEEKVPKLFTELRQLAAQNSVEIGTLTVRQKMPSEEAKGTGFNCDAQPVDMSFTGQYLDVLNFFSNLREKEFLLRIPRLSFHQAGTGPESITADFELFFFVTGSARGESDQDDNVEMQ